eukprot:scaffold16423_cov55-Cyclotella_meneghiniana.AAC.6
MRGVSHSKEDSSRDSSLLRLLLANKKISRRTTGDPHSSSRSTMVNERDPLVKNGHSADEENLRRLKGYQWWAFLVTFGGYFMSHFSRKCYSTVKQQLQSTAGYSPLILSEMDTVFMGTYAAGTAVMGNWFCDKKSVENRGLIFGLWTCHQYMGDITAGVCTAVVLGAGAPYWWALLIPSVCNVAWAFLTVRLVADPADMGIITPEVRIRMEKLAAKKAAEGDHVVDEGPAPITYVAALQIPMVANYAFAFGFFKLTNYVLFFWLPYFLGKHFDPVTANLIASLYSVGMMPGGIIVGVVSDLFGGRRASVIGTFMGCLFIFLFIFSKCSETLTAIPLLVMLAIMGILVGGPNNIITSAVAADLSSHPSVRGNNKSLGTVTGLINGCGSITASIGLLAVGPLQAAFGWSSVWVFLMGATATGTLLLGSKIKEELFPAPAGYHEVEANLAV